MGRTRGHIAFYQISGRRGDGYRILLVYVDSTAGSMAGARNNLHFDCDFDLYPDAAIPLKSVPPLTIENNSTIAWAEYMNDRNNWMTRITEWPEYAVETGI